jgi:hypothetical protein
MKPNRVFCSALVVGSFVPGVARAAAADETPDHAAAERPGTAREAHGPSSQAFPSHRFQWAPRVTKNAQLGVNFGLVQLALGGFNVAAEVRYRTLWFEYSHGVNLTFNDAGGLALSSEEQQQGVHVYVPYTTGFGVGTTVLDELWLGVEFKTHRYEVSAPEGGSTAYQTYSIGPVLGYKFFVWRGLHVNAYLRYWPNVATSLDGGKVALQKGASTVTHEAHDLGVFANVSVGYAFDL